ncbi:MAG: TIGR03862 family flavoprotein [Verrucomicrobiae bacterium]|nr:TIGR03862 family flavoprotein [Verrucomicrobiae bacterium]
MMKRTVAIVGGGPAGLRAAEVLAENPGLEIVLFDAKPSVGRKFLVAGRGGLNLTHSEPVEKFAGRYSGDPAVWQSLLADFDPQAMTRWVRSLGLDTYVGTSGRIFPEGNRSAELLRAWVRRIKSRGVQLRMRHRWGKIRREDHRWQLAFETPDGAAHFAAEAVVFALGGGSWPETGSDARWVEAFAAQQIALAPMEPANCGWEVDWPAAMLGRIEGRPLKNIAVRAGPAERTGELLVTRYGLEGGALYALGHELRRMKQPSLLIDFKPELREKNLVHKLGDIKKGEAFDRARNAWNLSDVCVALLERAGARTASVHQLVGLVKSYRLVLKGPRPLAEAISTAGGVRWAELDSHLMLRKMPGVFLAGEMIDWEAPTGGYLMQGCFATGTRAAAGVAGFLHPQKNPAG